MKLYIIMLPLIFMMFIYMLYHQVYITQNLKINQIVNNSLYSSYEEGYLRSYYLNTIDEEKLIYNLIIYSSQELKSDSSVNINFRLISDDPYMIEVTMHQEIPNNNFEISKIFVLDSKG